MLQDEEEIHMMPHPMILLSLLAAALGFLSGCAGNAPDPGAVPSEQPVRYESLPETKELQVTVEGMTETASATLAKSDLGYAIYVLEGFEFTPEEPNQDMVFHQSYPDYFLRIQPMGADTNLEKLRKESEEALRSVNQQIVDLKPSFFDRQLATQAEFILQSSNDQATLEMIAMRIGNKLFRFTLHLPHQEASEGVVPRFYPMIHSIVPIK